MFDFIKSNMFLCLVIFLAVVAPSFLFGAMKFIVIFILIGVAIIYLLSLILGVRVTRMQRDMNNMAGAQQQQQRQQQQRRREGDVHIFANGEKGEKRVAKDVGDYVDFEEVKEDKR